VVATSPGNTDQVHVPVIGLVAHDYTSPETTDGRDGFVHPYVMDASVDRTSVKFLIRDFATAALKDKEAMLEALARATVRDWPGVSVAFKVQESYRNMKEILDRSPNITENLREAIRRSGLELRENAVRGGTDGSRLSFMGLPTPNLFAGSNNVHSRLEWVSVQDLEKSVETIVNLCRIWDERA
jgi:tripeptide aminopeptidase